MRVNGLEIYVQCVACERNTKIVKYAEDTLAELLETIKENFNWPELYDYFWVAGRVGNDGEKGFPYFADSRGEAINKLLNALEEMP